jgi:hypothetical protein
MQKTSLILSEIFPDAKRKILKLIPMIVVLAYQAVANLPLSLVIFAQ